MTIAVDLGRKAKKNKIKVLALKCLVAEEFSSLGLISMKLNLSKVQNTSLVLN